MSVSLGNHSEKLGLIAGGGELPKRLADAARAEGRDYFVLALDGYADDWVKAHPHAYVGLGAVGLAIRTLKGEGCKGVIIAGIVQRPDLSKLNLDFRGARLLPKVAQAMRGGDDQLLRVILGEFEKEGFEVWGADDLLGDLLAPAGPLTRLEPHEEAAGDIERAIDIVKALGRQDVGQGAVVCRGVCLAVEAVEGTDAMLGRLMTLPAHLRGTEKARAGVLVKLPKPGQERRIDLPTIGPSTVERCAEAGLAGIAVAAGAALILGRGDVEREAERLGLFVIGLKGPWSDEAAS